MSKMIAALMVFVLLGGCTVRNSQGYVKYKWPAPQNKFTFVNNSPYYISLEDETGVITVRQLPGAGKKPRFEPRVIAPGETYYMDVWSFNHGERTQIIAKAYIETPQGLEYVGTAQRTFRLISGYGGVGRQPLHWAISEYDIRKVRVPAHIRSFPVEYN